MGFPRPGSRGMRRNIFCRPSVISVGEADGERPGAEGPYILAAFGADRFRAVERGAVPRPFLLRPDAQRGWAVMFSSSAGAQRADRARRGVGRSGRNGRRKPVETRCPVESPPLGDLSSSVAEAFADLRDGAWITFRTHLPAPGQMGAPLPARPIIKSPKVRRFPPRGLSAPAPAGPGRAVPPARPLSISLPGTGAQGGGVLVHGTCIEEGPARDRANDHRIEEGE